MSIYEEVEIEDMIYSEKDYSYTYQCPCGDIFRITFEELHDGEDIAKCPSCTLRIMVIYDIDGLPSLPTEDAEDNDKDDELDDDNNDNSKTSDTLDSKIINQIGSITVSGWNLIMKNNKIKIWTTLRKSCRYVGIGKVCNLVYDDNKCTTFVGFGSKLYSDYTIIGLAS